MEWRMILAAVAWTSVLALALIRTVAEVEQMTVWAVIAGQIALVFTGWLIGDRVVRDVQAEALREHRELDERAVERVAQRLAQALKEDGGNVSSMR